MALANPPSLDILVRDSCTFTKFSDDGSKLMVIRSDSIIAIYDSKNLVEIRALQVPNLLAASISLCGTYVQTIQKSASPQIKNVNNPISFPIFRRRVGHCQSLVNGMLMILLQRRDLQ